MRIFEDRIRWGAFVGGVILFLLSHVVCVGQESELELTTTEFDLSLDIPSLEVMIDSAIQFAPQVDYKSLAIDIADREIQTKRWEWLKYIYLQGNYQYGNLQNFAVAYDEQNNAQDNTTVSTQNRYSFGISANLPIASIWDRQNQNKVTKLKRDQAIHEYQIEIQSIRQLVIGLYSQLLLEHEEIIVANSNKQSTDLQIVMATKQFASGQMLLIDYANMKQIELQADRELITAKLNFRKTKALLREIVGFNF